MFNEYTTYILYIYIQHQASDSSIVASASITYVPIIELSSHSSEGILISNLGWVH